MLSHVVNREEEERRSHNESYSLDYHIVKTKSENQGKREAHTQSLRFWKLRKFSSVIPRLRILQDTEEAS